MALSPSCGSGHCHVSAWDYRRSQPLRVLWKSSKTRLIQTDRPTLNVGSLIPWSRLLDWGLSEKKRGWAGLSCLSLQIPWDLLLPWAPIATASSHGEHGILIVSQKQTNKQTTASILRQLLSDALSQQWGRWLIQVRSVTIIDKERATFVPVRLRLGIWS